MFKRKIILKSDQMWIQSNNMVYNNSQHKANAIINLMHILGHCYEWNNPIIFNCTIIKMVHEIINKEFVNYQIYTDASKTTNETDFNTTYTENNTLYKLALFSSIYSITL